MQDMTFIIGPNRPVAEIWATLGAAGLGIEAACTFPSVDGRVVRVVLADSEASKARQVLLDAGFGAIDSHEVIIVELDNRPGDLGELAAQIDATGAKLTTLYMAMGDRVVVGADDLDRVRNLFGSRT